MENNTQLVKEQIQENIKRRAQEEKNEKNIKLQLDKIEKIKANLAREEKKLNNIIEKGNIKIKGLAPSKENKEE